MAQAAVATEETKENFKKWCFHETVRIERGKQELKEEMSRFEEEKQAFYTEKFKYESKKKLERAKFENDTHVFDMKVQILQDELRKMAAEREELRKEREYSERKNAENIKNMQFIYFAGVCSEDSLKRRYRSLMKIYHPDNMDGDEATLVAINDEYERILAML